MSLTRTFPVPSDRMGMLWALMSIQDAVVLEYSTAGTTHYSLDTMRTFMQNLDKRIFSTHMSENDVVFGDTNRLEKALLEIDINYKPPVIFVLNSSVSSLIGTDIKGICENLQEKTAAKLIPVESAGLQDDYKTGLQQAYLLAAKNFGKRYKNKTDSYNLVGLSPYNYRAIADKNEIIRIMNEAFSLELNASLLLKTDLTQLENLSQARFNVCLTQEGVAACECLKEKFGMDYLLGYPYGYAGTLDWIQCMEKTFSMQADFKFISAIKQKAQNNLPIVRRALRKSPYRTANLMGDAELLDGLSSFLQQAGIEVENAILPYGAKVYKNIPSSIQLITKEKERLSKIQSFQNSMVFGDEVSCHMCDGSNVCFSVSSPQFSCREFSSHMPLCGVHGADYLLEELYKTL